MISNTAISAEIELRTMTEIERHVCYLDIWNHQCEAQFLQDYTPESSHALREERYWPEPPYRILLCYRINGASRSGAKSFG